jgi:hypothetical protein
VDKVHVLGDNEVEVPEKEDELLRIIRFARLTQLCHQPTTTLDGDHTQEAHKLLSLK